MGTRCPMCETDNVVMVSRPGRFTRHNFVMLPIPDDMELPECTNCDCEPWGLKEAIKIDAALKLEYAKLMNPHQRWKAGEPHNHRSIALYNALADLDYNHNNDYFCWKKGGDGDNGEMLMYLLDMYFENEK